MKRIRTLLLLVPVTLCTSGLIIPGHVKNNTVDGNGVLLVYTGNINGTLSVNIGIHVEIDSSVGVRYDVVFEKGSNVMSHVALFYKFSDPLKTVIYNFVTHKSTVNTCCGSSGGGSNLKIVGNDLIDSFSCTHLQGVNNSVEGEENYWVSTQVPGYLKLLKILNNISPGLQQMFVNGNIFQWGGLVKLSHTSNGQEYANVRLVEANSTMTFPTGDFDVPSN